MPHDSQQAKILNNQRTEAFVVAVEMTDVSLIFLFKQFLLAIFEGLAHSILFLIVAGAALIRAILAIREAYLEKGENKKRLILRAIVETLAALAIGTAVVGTFAATAAFAIAGPIIFTATLGFKTLFHLGSAIYYGLKAAFSEESPAQKKAYRQKATANLILTFITGITTIATGLVFIAYKASFGILGIIGGVLGALYALYSSTRPATSSGRKKLKITVEKVDGDESSRPGLRATPRPSSGLRQRSETIQSTLAAAPFSFSNTLTPSPLSPVALKTQAEIQVRQPVTLPRSTLLEVARLQRLREVREQEALLREEREKAEEMRRKAEKVKEQAKPIIEKLDHLAYVYDTGLELLSKVFKSSEPVLNPGKGLREPYIQIPTHWWDDFCSRHKHEYYGQSWNLHLTFQSTIDEDSILKNKTTPTIQIKMDEQIIIIYGQNGVQEWEWGKKIIKFSSLYDNERTYIDNLKMQDQTVENVNLFTEEAFKSILIRGHIPVQEIIVKTDKALRSHNEMVGQNQALIKKEKERLFEEEAEERNRKKALEIRESENRDQERDQCRQHAHLTGQEATVYAAALGYTYGIS